MPDAREFAVQIDLEWAELMGGVGKAVQFLATEGLAMAQGLSPVDTGQFRANWLVSVGQRDGRLHRQTVLPLTHFRGLIEVPQDREQCGHEEENRSHQQRGQDGPHLVPEKIAADQLRESHASARGSRP